MTGTSTVNGFPFPRRGSSPLLFFHLPLTCLSHVSPTSLVSSPLPSFLLSFLLFLFFRSVLIQFDSIRRSTRCLTRCGKSGPTTPVRRVRNTTTTTVPSIEYDEYPIRSLMDRAISRRTSTTYKNKASSRYPNLAN